MFGTHQAQDSTMKLHQADEELAGRSEHFEGAINQMNDACVSLHNGDSCVPTSCVCRTHAWLVETGHSKTIMGRCLWWCYDDL